MVSIHPTFYYCYALLRLSLPPLYVVGAGVNFVYSPPPVTNIPAILALVSVAITPLNSADMATFATLPLRPGANCDSTPIWMPTLEILPKPQTA
jgi:hypothetical protein